MAFWGVEVKPRKPFTLTFSDFEAPRLRLSQATLGKSKSDERTIVGCSVNDSPVVYICSLLPGTVETCSLNLCFDGDVTFSVRGSSTVHLAGYFDGFFDGNESGEDVEEDGYSQEDEEEGSDDESLDGFIVSGDEDTYDDDEEWSSEEDVLLNTRKSGVTIEEIHDEPSAPVSKKDGESHERSIVPHVRKRAVAKETADRDGNLKQSSENLGTVAASDDNHKRSSEDKHTSSSEDEDGFRVKRKRIRKHDNDEQPSKKMATNTGAEALQPGISPVAEEMDTDSRGLAKKKKKKKKKKGNKDLPDANDSDNHVGRQVREEVRESGHDDPQQLTETVHKSSIHDDNAKKAKLKSRGADVAVVSSEEGKINKKGTLRKYPNGLEVENTSMGKPDGRQATPGKKVGVIYTGRLRSTDKIFDSNVGRKPFYFRLGVGEVIKGWDIGINGMRVGDKRRISIPPQLGYGSKGMGKIPPNSCLVFTVELVEVK